MEAQGRFKVLIAGAGITGLTLAHCLEKADIDYTLFDKGIIAPPFGSTITIFPHGIRILHQLDFLNQIKNQSAPMGGSNCRGSNGKIFAACEKYFTVLRSLTGYDTRTIGRQEFLQLMYDRLPDKRKVFERARVERVVTENSKIRLVLADGREFIGDLLVGADGVHSKVRELMWNNATRIVPSMITHAEKQAMKTTYAAIVGLSMPMSDLETFEAVVNTSHNKISFLVICQPKWVSWQVFTKLREDEQFCGPDRRKFGEEDMKVLIEKIADYPITEKVKFAELWENRTRAQMVSLEEGVFDHWFLDRIVLAGDAAHKVTPNSGFGGSTAMEDAVSIANAIHTAITTCVHRRPNDEEIRSILQHYQESRIRRAKRIVKVGGEMTRRQAYDGWMNYLQYRWFLPLIGMEYIAQETAKLCNSAPKLTFVEFKEEQGLLRWGDHKLRKKGQQRYVKLLLSLGYSVLPNTHILGLLIISVIAWYMIIDREKEKMQI